MQLYFLLHSFFSFVKCILIIRLFKIVCYIFPTLSTVLCTGSSRFTFRPVERTTLSKLYRFLIPRRSLNILQGRRLLFSYGGVCVRVCEGAAARRTLLTSMQTMAKVCCKTEERRGPTSEDRRPKTFGLRLLATLSVWLFAWRGCDFKLLAK